MTVLSFSFRLTRAERDSDAFPPGTPECLSAVFIARIVRANISCRSFLRCGHSLLQPLLLLFVLLLQLLRLLLVSLLDLLFSCFVGVLLRYPLMVLILFMLQLLLFLCLLGLQFLLLLLILVVHLWVSRVWRFGLSSARDIAGVSDPVGLTIPVFGPLSLAL